MRDMEEGFQYCYYSGLPSPLAYMEQYSEPLEKNETERLLLSKVLCECGDKRLIRIKAWSPNQSG